MGILTFTDINRKTKTYMKKIILSLITLSSFLAINTSTAQSFTEDKVKALIEEMDDNSDTKINFEEFYEEKVTDNKDSLDSNRDGYITSGEIVLEIKEDLIQTIKEMRKQGVSEKAINKTIANELKTAEKEAAALIKKMDADKDQLVEPEEIKAYQRKQFKKLDVNSDGIISGLDTPSGKIAPSRGYTVVPYDPSK